MSMEYLSNRALNEWIRDLKEQARREKPFRDAEKKRMEKERIRKELEALEKKYGVKFTSYEP